MTEKVTIQLFNNSLYVFPDKHKLKVETLTDPQNKPWTRCNESGGYALEVQGKHNGKPVKRYLGIKRRQVGLVKEKQLWESDTGNHIKSVTHGCFLGFKLVGDKGVIYPEENIYYAEEFKILKAAT